MAEKLSELKERLTSLGISTNTPGLRGKERLEELRNRLEDALCSDEPRAEAAPGGGSRSVRGVVEGLSSAQIRENLNLLGQNTNTPGLNGEQRRLELMRRLIEAVETANMTETFVQELEAREHGGGTGLKPSVGAEHRAVSNDSKAERATAADERQPREPQDPNLAPPDERPEAQELARLVEQRVCMVQMRLQPGPVQESRLKALDATLLQVIAEIDFLQMNKSKDKFRKESSVLINDGELMSVGRLLGLLAEKRSGIIEKMEIRKQQIIESENAHPVYGLAIEQDLRVRLAAALRADGERHLVGAPEQTLSRLRERVASVKDRLGSSADMKKDGPHSELVAEEKQRVVPRQPEGRPKQLDTVLVAEEKVQDESSEESDDGQELPPLIGRVIPPPVTAPSSKPLTAAPLGEVEDILAPLTLMSDIRRPPPLSTMSELPTDSTFRTDFSPTAEMAPSKESHRVEKKGGIDVKSLHRSNAEAAGYKAPDRDDEDEQDMYVEDSGGEEDVAGLEHAGSDEIAVEDIRRIKELRLEARRLEKARQLDDAEATYLQALEVDPTDIRTLDKYAIFLHRRRGELPRAAAFFRRAIQECVPSLLQPHGDRPPVTSPTYTPAKPLHSSGAMRSDAVTQVLLHYGRFLQRAQGDMTLAEDVFRRAVQVSPSSASAWGSLGRFLSEDRAAEAEECFARALRNEPDNVTHLLWYAKLLKASRKIIQADVMYSAALKKSSAGGPHSALEPTAMCNYASFLLKYRHDATRAEQLFKEGLDRFPKHKGLVRNYKHFSKVAAQKRIRAPPKVPVDIDEQLAMRDEKSPPREAMDERKPPMHVVDVARSTEDQSLCGESPPSVLAGRNREAISCNNSKHQERPAEERKDRGEEKYAGCEFGGNEKEYAGDEMVRGYNQGAINAEGNEGDFNNDAAADDASVVSALTCQFSEREITHASHPPIRPSASDLIVELDGFLSVPGMYCVGITECREGGSKPVLMDLSDSVVSMTVAIKPGAWRWIRDLSVDSRGVHSATINIGDVDEDEYAEVDLRSSMIVSVHQKSKSNLVSASMLGFVVLTMTAVLASPQIEPNVHLVERSFSSERYAIDSIDGSEKRIKVEGKMKLCLRIDIRQGDNL